MPYRRTLQGFATVVLCLWLAVAQAYAGCSMLLCGAGSSGGGGGVTFSLAWVATATEASGGTVITYPGVSLGAASPNRIIAVFAANRAGTTGATVSSVTVDGVSATQVSGAAGTGTAGKLISTDIWYANLGAASDNNTSGNIVVTWTNSQRTGIEVYRIITATPTPTAGAQNTGTGSASIAQSITVPSGGGAISGASFRTTAAISFTNATLDNTSAFSGANSQYASGNATVAGATTITATCTGNASDDAISLAAWGP